MDPSNRLDGWIVIVELPLPTILLPITSIDSTRVLSSLYILIYPFFVYTTSEKVRIILLSLSICIELFI